jgi:hypothetical protein
MFHAESKEKRSRNVMDEEKKLSRDIINSIVQAANNKNRYTDIISKTKFHKRIESILSSPSMKYKKENLLDICYFLAKIKIYYLVSKKKGQMN